jgi:hypothetical protein
MPTTPSLIRREILNIAHAVGRLRSAIAMNRSPFTLGRCPVRAISNKAKGAIVNSTDQITAKGANVFAISDRAKQATPISRRRTDYLLSDSISLITSFCEMVKKVAISRGNRPDRRRHFRKVTETI